MDEKKPDAPPPISNDNDEFEVDWKLTKISLAVQEDRVLKATGIDSLQNSNQTPVKPMEKNSVTPPPVKILILYWQDILIYVEFVRKESEITKRMILPISVNRRISKQRYMIFSIKLE